MSSSSSSHNEQTPLLAKPLALVTGQVPNTNPRSTFTTTKAVSTKSKSSVEPTTSHTETGTTRRLEPLIDKTNDLDLEAASTRSESVGSVENDNDDFEESTGVPEIAAETVANDTNPLANGFDDKQFVRLVESEMGNAAFHKFAGPGLAGAIFVGQRIPVCLQFLNVTAPLVGAFAHAEVALVGGLAYILHYRKQNKMHSFVIYIAKKMNSLEQRTGSLEERMGSLENKLETVKEELIKVVESLRAHTDAKFQEVHKKLDEMKEDNNAKFDEMKEDNQELHTKFDEMKELLHLLIAKKN